MPSRARGTFTILLLLGLLALPCAAMAIPAPGQDFPDMLLPAPALAEDAASLGIAPGRPFRLSDVKADFLLLEAMSAMCPYCQADAPHINEVHAAIQKQGLGDRLKVLGVGVNNTEFEMELFRAKYGMLFPHVVDTDMTMVDKAGVVGTPTYFLLDLRGQGLKVLHVVEGRMDSPDAFLRDILAKTGLRGQAAGTQAKPAAQEDKK